MLNLDNLIAIVDLNDYQNEPERSQTILDKSSMEEKWKSFGWYVKSVDGHNIFNLIKSFNYELNIQKPKVVIAKTIKGKGVSFMENNNEWHHNRLTESNYLIALNELVQ